jgi:hypothetical protein
MTWPVVTAEVSTRSNVYGTQRIMRADVQWDCHATWWRDRGKGIRTVTGLNLRINLNTAICRNHVVGDWNALVDRDSLINDSIVLHVTHTQHAVDFGDTKPMQDIRHERLEAHVLDTSDVFGPFEVFASSVFSSLSGVVDKVFGHLTEGTTFLAEIDDDSTSAVLGFLDGFFDTESEVRTASADIRAEDIATIAFVVDTEG